MDKIIELGGTEEITIEDFLRRIHRIYYQKDPRVIHIPLSVVIPMLSFLENYFYSWLPLNVGQLSSFRYDGTIEKDELLLKHLPQMRNVEGMVSTVIKQEKQAIWRNNLIEECKLFCSYLVNQKANDYIQMKYIDGHKIREIDFAISSFSFDKLIMHIAKLNPFLTGLGDAYTRVFFKYSVLRKKLVLLLAILESCAPYHSHLDKVESCGKILLYLKLFQKGISFALLFLLSAILFLPLHFGIITFSKIRNWS